MVDSYLLDTSLHLTRNPQIEKTSLWILTSTHWLGRVTYPKCEIGLPNECFLQVQKYHLLKSSGYELPEATHAQFLLAI